MNAQKISTIIFDLGTVLINIDVHAFANTLGLRTEEQRLPYKDDIKKNIIRYESGKITTEQFIEENRKIFQNKFSPQEIQNAWNNILLGENEEINFIVEKIQKKYHTAILSNTSAVHWEIALHYPIVKKFYKYFLSFEIGYVKPQQEIYHHVVQSMSTPPNTILFIDDIAENIDGAKSCGINGIVFENAMQLESEFQKLSLI